MRVLPLLLTALVACNPSDSPVDTSDTGLDCAPQADPASVIWDEVLLDAENKVEVMVTNTCGEDLTLTMATEGDETFSVLRATLPVFANESTSIDVVFQAADLDEHTGELVLTTPGGTTRVALQGQNSSDWDGDGHEVELAGGDDCDDSASSIHPGAVEIPCDGIDSDCDGALDGASVGTKEYSDLTEAFTAAAAGAGKTIYVCPGTHPVHAEVAMEELSVLPWDTESDPPVLDGESNGRILDFDGDFLEITSMVLANGAANGDGGAIRSDNAHIVLDSVSFLDNTATGEGGAIAGNMAHQPLVATSSSFEGNTAGTHGGALALRTAGEVVLSECTVDGNTATAGDGGGILAEGYPERPAQIEISDSIVSNNIAAAGGGGLALGQVGSAVVTLREDTFATNSAEQGGGVGASTDDASELTLETCSFTGNSADSGGAVYYYGAATKGDLVFNGGSYSNNTATTQGGGLYVFSAGNLDMEMSSNVSFSGCSAPSGGAIYADGSGYWSSNLDKVTLQSNSGTQGAALYLGYATMVLNESKVNSNTATGGGAAYMGESAAFTTRLSNWGSGSTENEDYDVMCSSGATYDGYSSAAHFVCSGTECH